jgi:hypothetical protein
MTTFLRLLASSEKEVELASAVKAVRTGSLDTKVFFRDPAVFSKVPSSPFSYWEAQCFLDAFDRLPPFESNGRKIFKGAATSDNFRFVRTAWECEANQGKWFPYAKGGEYSPVYSDIPLLVNWSRNAAEMEAEVLKKYPYLNGDADWVLHRESFYFQPGITWPARTTSQLGMRVMPKGAVFGHKGPAGFLECHQCDDLLSLLAVCISAPFLRLVGLQLAAGDAAARSYEIGTIQRTPIPEIPTQSKSKLATLAKRYWNLKRSLDTVSETSHAFMLPAVLRSRLGAWEKMIIEAELVCIQDEIDAIAFLLYGITEDDRRVQLEQLPESALGFDAEEDDMENVEPEAAPVDALLSWAVGVAFGRFDWRLATGERVASSEPDPFDPLPAKSPGMLLDGAEPFHVHAGILVDDQGHPHDLARLVEEVLARVDMSISDNERCWLQRDFFAFHLQRYSKSRRKAPIYWPLSTASGSYTLWIYYPSLNNQTLFAAVNDFLDGPNGKLTQVSRECAELRMKGGGRSRDEEKQYEMLQTFEQELTDLRDTLLKIAPTYQPNHDDGVQITAAPLWPLFRHKSWQKVLKDTWTKLEKGDYDWAHLAMAYWPERVRKKCKTEKSLAIAHGLEELYVEPDVEPKRARAKKMAKGDE